MGSDPLPHPITGQPFASPVPPGTGWPGDPATASTPVANTPDAVARLAALDLEPGKARYIEPGHIIAQVKRIRAQRLADHGPLIPPPGLDGTTEYLAWIRQASAVVASGGSLPTPPAVAADPGRSAAVIASIRDALPTAPTIRALDEENAQSRAPQHPNPYRQPEGNRA